MTCGGGTEIQVRHCTNPRPQHGGLPCQGSGVQSRSCNEDPCPGPMTYGVFFFY